MSGTRGSVADGYEDRTLKLKSDQVMRSIITEWSSGTSFKVAYKNHISE